MKWLMIKAMKEEIWSACKSTSWNDDLLSNTEKLSRKIKRLVNEMKVRGEIWYDDEMIPLAESGDQRSTKKKKTRRDKICGTEKF